MLRLRTSTALFSRALFSGQQRAASTVVPITDLRPGNFIKFKNQFCVVLDQRRIMYGRATAYVKLDYHLFNNDDVCSIRMVLDDSIEKIEPDRFDVTFSYFDFPKKIVMINDSEYNEVEIPLSLFPTGIETVLQSGDPLTLYKYEGTWISYSMNNALQSKLKKIQNRQ